MKPRPKIRARFFSGAACRGARVGGRKRHAEQRHRPPTGPTHRPRRQQMPRPAGRYVRRRAAPATAFRPAANGPASAVDGPRWRSPRCAPPRPRRFEVCQDRMVLQATQQLLPHIGGAKRLQRHRQVRACRLACRRPAMSASPRRHSALASPRLSAPSRHTVSDRSKCSCAPAERVSGCKRHFAEQQLELAFGLLVASSSLRDGQPVLQMRSRLLMIRLVHGNLAQVQQPDGLAQPVDPIAVISRSASSSSRVHRPRRPPAAGPATASTAWPRCLPDRRARAAAPGRSRACRRASAWSLWLSASTAPTYSAWALARFDSFDLGQRQAPPAPCVRPSVA